MATGRRHPLAVPLAFAAMSTLIVAPIAGAAPRCTQTSPTTTQCETPGHTQIVTSPPEVTNDIWWPYGGFAFGFPR